MDTTTLDTKSPAVISTQASRITAARASKIPPTAKLLLRTLVDYMGQKDFCWPSVKSLTAEINVSLQHARRLLRTLEVAGFIRTEPRFRSDGSQASNVFRWAWTPPNIDVPPPEPGRSPIKHPKEETNKTHAAEAECDLNSKKSSSRPKPSKRFITFNGAAFRKPDEAKRGYDAAVAGKFINAGAVDRVTFYACWCEICTKLNAGKVEAPEKLMRFLLNDRRVMAEYPTQAAETKARQLINHLYPAPSYNPHN